MVQFFCLKQGKDNLLVHRQEQLSLTRELQMTLYLVTAAQDLLARRSTP